MSREILAEKFAKTVFPSHGLWPPYFLSRSPPHPRAHMGSVQSVLPLVDMCERVGVSD